MHSACRSIPPFLLAALFLWAQPGAAQEPETPHRHPEVQELHNPVPADAESVAHGKALYLRYCRTCHGVDGRGQTDMIEFLAYPPSDLTDDEWRHGRSDGEIFAVVRDGTVDDMEAFANRLSQEDIWHLVNYIRTLGGGSS